MASCPQGICGDLWVLRIGRTPARQLLHRETDGLESCPESCNNNGDCYSGFCSCYHPFTGESCSSVKCPGDRCIYSWENHRHENCHFCSDNGLCMNNGTCVCIQGYAGEDCSIGASCGRRAWRITMAVSCPNDCSGKGDCKIGGVCDCYDLYSGEDCSIGARGAHQCLADSTAQRCARTIASCTLNRCHQTWGGGQSVVSLLSAARCQHVRN